MPPAAAPVAPVASSSSGSSAPHDVPASAKAPGAGQTHGQGVDEQTLDKMAQRLVKRDPGPLIEKDDVLRSYVYKFVDRDSGALVRQFPAASILATMRALQQLDDGKQAAAISAAVEA